MVRWNSRCTPNNSSNGEHSHQQQEHISSSRNSSLERKAEATFSDDDDDEQDYSCDHHFDDDDIDCDPHDYTRCGGGFGEPQSVPPSSNFHELDDELASSMPMGPTGDNSTGLPPFGMIPTPLSSCDGGGSGRHSSMDPASLSASSAVVIEDPGLDHELPPDECSPVLAPAHVWRPQNQSSTCEFTHTILHYSQKRESGCKKAEYSATTVDAFGNKWRLIVYVNGNGRASNHHLSLFLQVADADELPFGWKKAVSYVLTLEHPSGPSLGYAKRNPDKTFKLCPKAIDWGWSQFITSDRIQQEGYISNDSLTVRASVTVKSSSVSIDAEDAELYLKCAVEEGNAQAVVACLSQGASVNCQFKDDLYTPLHTACSSSINNGSLEVLKLLLERGADGNACNKWRETPLLIAANNGHRTAVELLLDHGADPSLCSEAGWSALTFAAHKGYEDIVTLLLIAGAPVNCRVTEDLSTPLHKACAGGKPGHLSAVQQLLDAGADVHALNKWRETPLLTAANHGQAKAVSALLRAGADPCKCTDTGWSPLSIAAYKGHDDVVRLLLEEGAPTEEADPTLSALLQAATKGLPDTVELLLRHGADHTVTTKKGDTALSILVEQNLIDAAVEMVTEYKASVPRCSRDRKKVQRARLLINLRIKQQQREGLLNGHIDSDEDDSEQDESDDGSKSALHASNESPSAVAPRTHKKKKKDKVKSRESAEAEAKAAERALLLEIEKEEHEALKVVAIASCRKAKKKKKRDRDRQQRDKEIRNNHCATNEIVWGALEENEQRDRQLERKELEREQKLKEQQEKEQYDKEQKDKERIERELKEKEERERQNETEERERQKRIKGKELKDKEKKLRENEKKNRDQRDKKSCMSNNVSSGNAKMRRGTSKGSKPKRQLPQAPPVDNSIDTLSSKNNFHRANLTNSDTKTHPLKNRGWETKQQVTSQQPLQKQTLWPVDRISSPDESTSSSSVQSKRPPPQHPDMPQVLHLQQSEFSAEEQLKDMANDVVDFLGFDTNSNIVHDHQQSLLMSTLNLKSDNQSTTLNGLSSDPGMQAIGCSSSKAFSSDNIYSKNTELPAAAIFQQEKVMDLFHRFSSSGGHVQSTISQRDRDPLSMVGERTLRTIVYRYMIRAAHCSSTFLDPVIPSWTDNPLLVAFLQRQLISENRRSMSPVMGHTSVSIEVMKEAGSACADLCLNLAKELAQFRSKCKQQMPNDWTDSSIGVTASEMLKKGSPFIVIDWAGRSQISISTKSFSALSSRYRGSPHRLLTAIFSMVKRYETRRYVVAGTTMDNRLPPATLACLSNELSVSVEACTDPLSVYGDNAFFSPFADVDTSFGSLFTFGKENGDGEKYILEHGGSIAVMPPLESATAAIYVQNMVDLLEKADTLSLALSFAVFLPSECFRELTSDPGVGDLPLLDARLGDRQNSFVCRVKVLALKKHVFYSGDGDGIAKLNATGSLFVLLQNERGKCRFSFADKSIENIMLSMSPHAPSYPKASSAPNNNNPFLNTVESISALPNSLFLNPDLNGLTGLNSGTGLYEPSRGGSRHGRLFELVDDGEDEISNDNSVDVVSGMLNNLNVNIRDNNSQDVDIEAISLMGIGGFMNSSQVGGMGRFG